MNTHPAISSILNPKIPLNLGGKITQLPKLRYITVKSENERQNIIIEFFAIREKNIVPEPERNLFNGFAEIKDDNFVESKFSRKLTENHTAKAIHMLYVINICFFLFFIVGLKLSILYP